MENKSEFLDFIVENNLLDNTYSNYLVRTSKNGLKQNERNYLNYVLTGNSEKLKEIQSLEEQKIPDILRNLSDSHFSVKNFTNVSIYDYFNKPDLDQTLQIYLRKLVIIHKHDGTKDLNINFLVYLLNISLFKKINGDKTEDYIFSNSTNIIQENKANLKINDNLEALISVLFGWDSEACWKKITRLRNDGKFSNTIDKIVEILIDISETSHSNQTLIRDEIIKQIILKLQSIKFEVVFDYIPFSKSIPELTDIENNLVSHIINQKKYIINDKTLIPIISYFENRKIERDNFYDNVSVDKSKEFIKANLPLILRLINDYKEKIIDLSDFDMNIDDLDKICCITSKYKNFSELYNIVRTTENSSELFKAVPYEILWSFVNDKKKMDKSKSEIIDALKIIDSDFLINKLNEPNFNIDLSINKDFEIIKFFKTSLDKSKITNENLIILLNSKSNQNKKKNNSKEQIISKLINSGIEINSKQVRQISTKDIIAFEISKKTNEEKLRYEELIKVKISTLKNGSSTKKLKNRLKQVVLD
ncbi:TPA: hypothetical protein U0J99_002007 [Streptococcus suis]|nr:hypothetical protein [Streptococcus suis]